MKTAAISKLKAMLSEYLSGVKRGEEVLITERGKPIARIVPVRGGAPDDARRSGLARKGVIRLGQGRPSPEFLRSLPVVSVPMEVVQRAMDQEREGRV